MNQSTLAPCYLLTSNNNRTVLSFCVYSPKMENAFFGEHAHNVAPSSACQRERGDGDDDGGDGP